MKKLFGFIGILVLLLVVGAVLLTTVDFNRMGKNNVYVEVIEPTEIQEDKLDTGEVMTSYLYKQTAFNEKGEAIEVEFSAQKELRQGAFLKLYVKQGNKVTSYDEVKWGDVPAEVQKKLKE